jgi:hypothetical protein
MATSVTMTHPGKSAPAVVMTFSVKIVMVQLKAPKMKTRGDSVDGASHDLRSVGSPATWSAQTKEINAIVGSFTKAQNARPAKETMPQTTSKGPSRQTLWGFLNETMTTAHGTKPSINVMSEANPTCCCNSTPKAKTPSTPHNYQVTRFGDVIPRQVSRTYEEPPTAASSTAR